MLQALRVRKVVQDLGVESAHKAQLALPDQLGQPVLLDPLVRVDLKDQLARLGQAVDPDLLVLLDHKVHVDLLAHPDHKDPLDLPVQLDQQAPKALPVQLARHPRTRHVLLMKDLKLML